MLKRLFTSNTRIKLLTVFIKNPGEEFFIRELTRNLDEQINSIRRELDNLKKMGFLRTRTKNRKKYYYVNKGFIIFEELQNIILKVASGDNTVAKEVEKMGNVKLLVLSGQFIGEPTTSVDMLIVGEVEKERLANYLNNELKTERAVKFTILSEDDYRYRISLKDKFITEIITSEQSLIPIQKI